MNYFDFLAWPLAVIASPIFVMIALVVALVLVWAALRPWLSDLIYDWAYYRRPGFRQRLATPVSIIVSIVLSWLIIGGMFFVAAAAPKGWYWG